MGLDVARLLDRAADMAHACAAAMPAERNPGLGLGVVIGVLAKRGRDKVTLVTSPASATSGRGWSSCWPNPPARRATG